ncbi:hypothetical protein AVEN_4161-1, partial [Araneus ventricosus]
MDSLKKRRSAARINFTKTANLLKEELKKDASDKGILRVKLIRLQEYLSNLKDYDDKIIALLADSAADEDALSAEMEGCDKYRDEFHVLTGIMDEKLEKNTGRTGSISADDSVSSVSVKEKRYKLPKIEIKSFDGELINWLSFWAQFRKIHEDESLEECDKFHYLLQSMLPDTRARELMESYPLTSDNYQKAVSALKDRFGKKELLTEIYVRELLKLIMSNVQSHGKDKLSLSKLFDKIESHLRSLESMGIDQEKNAAWLYPMVESCLSTDILRAWQRSPQFNKNDKEKETQSRLSNLLEFLRKEVENEERVKLVRNTFGTPFVPREERGGGAKPKAGKGPVPTAAGLFTAKGHKCAFCGKAHESKECLIARSLSLQERVNKLKEGKCCLKCLSPGHFAKGCKAFIRCILCGKSHPVILCHDLPAKKEPESQGQELVSVQSNLSKPSCMSEVVLMTLIVEISNGVSKRKVRCLLDSGSQRSYILKSTAEALNLKSTSSENIAHTLFGGATTDARCHKKYSVKLSPLGKGTFFEFNFLEQEVICGNMPRLPKEQILKELKRHKIWISDLGDGCPKIEMLLGSDVYGKVITGGVKQLKGGLTAVNTKLGWTICGEHTSSNNENRELSTMLTSSFFVQNLKASELWDRTDDTLVIAPKFETKLDSPTKRKIISQTQGIFDPLRCLAPALLPAKLLVQQAWATKADWGTPTDTDIQSKYMQWLNELKELSKIKIPRRLGYGSPDHWTLHVFCDASLDAYAAVIFLRSRWWEGPAFLKGPPESWPNCEFMVDEESANSELKKEKVLDLTVKTEVRETAPLIHLPLDRIRESAVFEITGIDLCGPLFIKPKAKAWIVLFTCAVYRAIHLEVVTSLSTEAFIQSLRRFIARRGRPTTIYSDNGTNFTGTHNALREIDWERIASEEPFSPIKWKFIPPTAAWWGGWWERLIGSVKTLLLRVLGRSSLNYEELLTVSCDLETTINSRPLTYLSDEMEELMPLTSSLFLQDLKQTGVPDLDIVDSNKLNIRLKHCDSIRKELRSRFRK